VVPFLGMFFKTEMASSFLQKLQQGAELLFVCFMMADYIFGRETLEMNHKENQSGIIVA